MARIGVLRVVTGLLSTVLAGLLGLCVALSVLAPVLLLALLPVWLLLAVLLLSLPLAILLLALLALLAILLAIALLALLPLLAVTLLRVGRLGWSLVSLLSLALSLLALPGLAELQVSVVVRLCRLGIRALTLRFRLRDVRLPRRTGRPGTPTRIGWVLTGLARLIRVIIAHARKLLVSLGLG